MRSRTIFSIFAIIREIFALKPDYARNIANPFSRFDGTIPASFKEGDMRGNLFTQHPAEVGETYWQHQRVALGFAAALFTAGCAALVHAFLPFLFVKTGSEAIARLHDRMVVNRRKTAPASAPLVTS